MSISNKFFERLKERGNHQEIFYYVQRCLFNSEINGQWPPDENFLDQAHRLEDLLEEMSRKAKSLT